MFSGCVIGTPVNFGGMTAKGQAVILKNLKIVRSQKKLYLNEVVRILTGVFHVFLILTKKWEIMLLNYFHEYAILFHFTQS
jgi:hypothetical protein